MKVLEGVGNHKLLLKLQAALKHLPFSLCGAPGTGKKHLLTMAVASTNYKLTIYDLAHISTERGTRVNDLQRVLNRWMGNNNLDGNKLVLALYGAEHLDKEGAQMLHNCNVVLIATTRTEAMKSAIGRVIWAPRLTPIVMEGSLRILCPSANPQDIKRAVLTSNGDLRQAQLQSALHGDDVEKSGHVYFDVKDVLCVGKQKDLDYHERNWVS